MGPPPRRDGQSLMPSPTLRRGASPRHHFREIRDRFYIAVCDSTARRTTTLRGSDLRT